MRRVTICWPSSTVPRASWRSLWRSSSGSCRCPATPGCSWPRSTTSRRPATPSPESSASGILPAGLEMMDRGCIEAVNDYLGDAYPPSAAVISLRGRRYRGRGRQPSSSAGPVHPGGGNGATGRSGCPGTRRSDCVCGPVARRPSRRWAGWRPDYYCMDGTIPRRYLGRVLTDIEMLSRALRAAGRQCVPCRRRESAPAHPLRRQPGGRARPRRGSRSGDPGGLRGGRWHRNGRARRRGREAGCDVRPVLARRSSVSSMP